MKIERIKITVAELIKGYEERGTEGIEGVVAFNGKLDVRPAYQREYIYKGKDQDEVIRTVRKNFPLGIMYWAKTTDGRYELMDGQQRTIAICRYAAAKDEKNLKAYERCFSVDKKYFYNLTPDQQKTIMNYTLDIYTCDGLPSEILDWFKVINIAGKVLSAQELRNTSYTGPWLSDAKMYFSKPNCTAYHIGKDYVNGSAIRQEYLETAIRWIADRDGMTGTTAIDDYMALHQWDENASAIRVYFRRVIDWVQTIFPQKRKEMKGVDWGTLYNMYKDAELDPVALEEKIKELLIDDDVTDNKGIYPYLLTGRQKYLNLRTFSVAQKRAAYERQNGICPICKNHFPFEKMQGDHIIPWIQGGKTIPENCQMLCAECNGHKGDN